YIDQNISIIAADRFPQHSFALAGTEAGQFGADQISIPLIAVQVKGGIGTGLTPLSPGNQILVYLASQGFATVGGDDSQTSYGKLLQIIYIFLRHVSFLLKIFSGCVYRCQ